MKISLGQKTALIETLAIVPLEAQLGRPLTEAERALVTWTAQVGAAECAETAKDVTEALVSA